MDHDQATIVPHGLTRRTALKGAGAASLAALAARGMALGVNAQDATPSAGDYPTVEFTAEDYEYHDLPDSIPAGLTRLSMTNAGDEDHHAMFMMLTGDATRDDFDAAVEAGDFEAIFEAAESLGGPGSIGPGATSSVILDLEPGTYIVACLVPDEETGMLHAAMGMIADLEVTEAEGKSAAEPEADAEVDLVDYEFMGIPSEVGTGPLTWRVSDTGDEPHELVLYKQAPGVTYDQIEAIFQISSDASPVASPVDAEAEPMASPVASSEGESVPPFTAVAGVAPMTSGYTNYLELDLEAGDYFAICFIPDDETGAPHFALGMIMPFTVA